MENEDNKSRHAAEDPFTTMMFGRRNSVNTENENEQQSYTINYEELMVNIDKLVESAQNLKPLFHKVYPMIEQLWKKNK